jgi:DNA polymerase/3'-5' exonuclease PolX
MKNKEMASLFSRIADALEIKGEAAFKVLAYRKAARILECNTSYPPGHYFNYSKTLLNAS